MEHFIAFRIAIVLGGSCILRCELGRFSYEDSTRRPYLLRNRDGEMVHSA